MLKKIALTLALSSLSIAGSFAATNSDNLKEKNANNTAETAVTKAPAVEITNAWARPSTTTSSAIYMVISNPSANDATLAYVTALDVANKVAIHQTATESGGLARMVHLDKVVIPAGQSIELKPNGIHIMLMDLKKQLKAGDKFKATLKFDDGSAKVIEVEVKNNNM
ncbi:MAG: hypothetical protein K0Q51_24 [Rickettsiaceae bacterium]|nr:hypothetical protein [Rickettsiaceae bacterium]